MHGWWRLLQQVVESAAVGIEAAKHTGLALAGQVKSGTEAAFGAVVVRPSSFVLGVGGVAPHSPCRPLLFRCCCLLACVSHCCSYRCARVYLAAVCVAVAVGDWGSVCAGA
jgi:hypothetical protein